MNMRVPSSLFPNSLTGQLGKLVSRQNQLQTQAATGQRVQSAEEDPVGMRQVLDQERLIGALSRYSANIQSLQDRSKEAYSAIRGLQKLNTRAGEIATLADGAKSPEDLRIYAAEVNQLIEQGLASANRKHDGEFLFAGTKSASQAFTATRDANGRITGVVYAGNQASRDVEISEGVTVQALVVGANSSGAGASGLITDSRTGANFFAHLIALRDHLMAGNTAAISSTDAPALRQDEEHLLSHIAETGAFQASLESAAAGLTDRAEHSKGVISSVTSADLAETLVKLSQAQTAYQAALQSGAKIMQVSLMDYLR